MTIGSFLGTDLKTFVEAHPLPGQMSQSQRTVSSLPPHAMQ